MSNVITSNLNMSEFAQYLEEKKYPAGKNLFNQSDIIDGCHIIAKGTVHGVVRDDELGRQAKMNLNFNEGDVLGMTDLLVNSDVGITRNFSAVASCEVISFFISKQAFQQIQQDEKASAFFFKLALKSASVKKIFQIF